MKKKLLTDDFSGLNVRYTRSDAARALGTQEGTLRSYEKSCLPEFRERGGIDEIFGINDNKERYQWYVTIAEGVHHLREREWSRGKINRLWAAVMRMAKEDYMERGRREGRDEILAKWHRLEEDLAKKEFSAVHEKLKAEQKAMIDALERSANEA